MGTSISTLCRAVTYCFLLDLDRATTSNMLASVTQARPSKKQKIPGQRSKHCTQPSAAENSWPPWRQPHYIQYAPHQSWHDQLKYRLAYTMSSTLVKKPITLTIWAQPCFQSIPGLTLPR